MMENISEEILRDVVSKAVASVDIAPFVDQSIDENLPGLNWPELRDLLVRKFNPDEFHLSIYVDFYPADDWEGGIDAMAVSSR